MTKDAYLKNIKQRILSKAPTQALSIMRTLSSAGHQALLVGGCVRDSILERPVNDWDITTSATPEQVKFLFKHTIDTGIKHGTVTVLIDETAFEVTTFRIDGEYCNNRSPESVEFSSDFHQDAARRDFTVNAMGYDIDGKIYDYFNGLDDLNNKTIRAIGDANTRFTEDALRMMRAIRFSAQLNYEIEKKTKTAISSCNSLIQNISQERIRDELNKILTSDNPEKLELLHETNLLQYILPELNVCYNTTQNNPYHIFDVGTHSIKAVCYLENDHILRLSALLHDIAKPTCKITTSKGYEFFPEHAVHSSKLAYKILRRLRYDNKTIHDITSIIDNHTIEFPRETHQEQLFVRRCLKSMTVSNFKRLLKLRIADRNAGANPFTHEELSQVTRLSSYADEVINLNICISLKQLDIDGNDLKSLGFQGCEIANMLNKLLDFIIENPDQNKKEILLSIINSNKN